MLLNDKYKNVVFLDRDGVINRDEEGFYVTDWAEFEFLPDVLSALKKAKEENIAVIVISNQSAINRGMASEETIADIMNKMSNEIKSNGGEILDVFYCPHLPEDNCDCRKPRTGLFDEAAKKYDIDLKDTWFVGDKLSDVEASMRLGNRSLLIRDGQPVSRTNATEDDAEAIVGNLSEAIEYILKTGK